MRCLVQKFGGTSVASPERQRVCVSRVQAALRDGYRPVVVVSAMGRRGDPYATDTLLDLARSIGSDVGARDLDLLASCGETVATVVMCAVLRREGVPTAAFTGGQAGIITDRQFGNAQVIRVEPTPLLRALRQGLVPVVAGFQGVTPEGDITTLGRGGSDTTAAALGVALGAEVVEIYTDVDGVKTADPRLVPEARTLPHATYEEIVQMAHQGAKVIHPRAVEMAMQRNIPLRIRSTFDDGSGTLVAAPADNGHPWLGTGKIITGVTHIPNLVRFSIGCPDDLPAAREALLFRSLADAGVSVDLINVSPQMKAFCVAQDQAARAERVLRAAGFEPEVRPNCAKVSIVGTGMRGLPGVMALVVEALRDAGVRILQTADSHVTISCLVDEAATAAAVRALHERFGLSGTPEPVGAIEVPAQAGRESD